MDVVIIVVSSESQASYWQNHLESKRGTLLKKTALIFSVEEDWKGGAGNGLGTLYAFQKAQKIALSKNINLTQMLRSGASIGLYHAAGHGKRIAPLSLAERNNKGAVKLPGLFQNSPLTLLEAVILQTSNLANRSKGRLSVFWGDQLFLPSQPLPPPTAHVELFVKKLSVPNRSTWEEKSLCNYGIVMNSTSPLCLNKISWETFSSLPSTNSFYTNLGAFSLSLPALNALCNEFSYELSTKNESFDTDPDFWMPTTLSEELYTQLTGKNALPHYYRMKSFLNQLTDRPFMEVSDIGSKSYWWDLGNLSSYYKNLMKLTTNSEESKALRTLLGTPLPDQHGNCLIDCQCKHLHTKNSLFVNVQADKVQGEGLFAIDCTATSIEGWDAISYGIKNEEILLSPGQVFAQQFLNKPLSTTLSRNGKNDWEMKLDGNKNSYKEVFESPTHS